MPQWLWAQLGRLGAWARRAAAAALASSGRPVPRHVAFIMDGNRRFAEARSLHKVEGHTFGYRRLIDALEWCLELGVQCVSVYAFSIDNYRRSSEEVQTLMTLAQDKLAHMLQECEVLARHGVRVRVIGDLSLAPSAVQEAAAAVMAATAHHTQATLNLCFSYTASEELLRALSGVTAAADHSSSMSSSSGSISALEQQLYTAGCPPVDLLVRTSGETRLSDFLLWQSRYALLIFTPVLWPDFGFLDLVSAVLEFQRHAAHLQRLQAAVCQHASSAAAAAAAGEAAGRPAAEAPAGLQWPEQRKPAQLPLQPVKVAASTQRQSQGSPCSIASPASPSSPSSRSEASTEEVSIAAEPPAGYGLPASAPGLPLRKRCTTATIGAAAEVGSTL